ncbi:heterokaryon incompatibility protein-domain-containing protein [Cladorrhinum samala]|uniref:Heterokaryon incompatibility protein-domain-containing protein n=1 Tax=Cladorrhinum samala TaxID=585594 RepID=A0AAV9HGP2_9PEZI|nr:heterokaryon incompatibility protein-domain-containing protein [Cladorrhinum samala]
MASPEDSVLQSPEHAGIHCYKLLQETPPRGESVDAPEMWSWLLGPDEWPTIQSAAAAGCPECLLIRDIATELRSAERPENSTEPSPFETPFFALYMRLDEGLLAVLDWRCGGCRSTSPGCWLWARATGKTRWPTIPVEPGPVNAPEPPGLDLATQQIQSWIGDCNKGHDCWGSGTLPYLPTRVIDVGSDSTNPRLHVSEAGQRGQYAALSHCWGPPGMQPLMTTTHTLESHCDGMPLDRFPPTFYDAIRVARALGLRYLWIDCLCIVQDSPADWARESSRMALLYTDACITLAADFATDSASGLFIRDPSLKLAPRQFTHVDADGNEHTMYLRHQLPVALLPEFEPVPTRPCYRGEAASSLKSRGWVLQEEALSRRMVQFTNTELIWQCGKRRVCSCDLTVARFSDSPKSLADNIMKGPGFVVKTTEQEWYWKWHAWCSIVREFTHRELTYVEDRLPAMTGIAAIFPLPASEYLAGLWRSNLDNLLLWRHDRGRIVDTKNQTKSFRIPGIYAPTWSWACVSGPIIYSSIFGAFDRPDSQPADWKVLEARTTPSTANPYGPVSEGWIKVQGRMVPVAFRFGKPEEKKNINSLYIYPTGAHTQGPTEGYFSWCYMDAGVKAREWEDEAHDYFFLLAGFDVTEIKGRDERDYTVGLVLRRLKDDLEGTYTRIGIGCPLSGLWRKFDWSLVDRHVVMIV